MSNIYHRATFRQAIGSLNRTLRLKHIIRIFRLSEHVHHSPIERVGMITALMVERMPQATAYVPRRFLVQGIITGIFVIRGSIMRSLYQHGLLSPVAGCTAGRVVGTPVIHIIAPFTCEVSDFRVTLRHFHRMTELNREILRPFGLRITARITRRIRILFINKTFHMSGKILRIPCLV